MKENSQRRLRHYTSDVSAYQTEVGDLELCHAHYVLATSSESGRY